MGCQRYTYNERTLYMDEAVGCLCTFPANDYQGVSAERVLSLALLGAAVVLAHSEDIGEDGKWLNVPKDLPPDLVEDIKQQIKLA